MTTVAPETGTRRRRLCSVIAREQGDDPIGSAWAVERMLVIELALPWPEDFTLARTFPPALGDALETLWEAHPETGLLTIAPDRNYSREGWTRVIDFRYPPPPRALAERAEYLAPNEQLAPFLTRLFASDPAALALPGIERVDFAGRDLLICTHGAVDACCALFGYPLYRDMRNAVRASGSNCRVWRSTHFGGHRFAPTMLDFPEGRFWGFLTPEEGEALIKRDGSAADLRERYRGWAGFAEPRAQVLEREALMAEGWAWAAWPQQCEILEQDERGSMLLRITAFPDDAPPIVYEGLVEEVGTASVMHSTDGALEDEPIYRVRDVRRSVVADAECSLTASPSPSALGEGCADVERHSRKEAPLSCHAPLAQRTGRGGRG